MKQVSGVFITVLLLGSCMQSSSHSLKKAPERCDITNEIVSVYSHNLVEHFNKLTPQERIFIYFIMRASLPGNQIAVDQSHRHAPKIKAMLEYILDRKEDVLKLKMPFDVQQFLKDIETYLIYIWTNHGQYFVREAADEKRTPERLGLQVLTKNNLNTVLQALQYPDAIEELEAVEKSLFDRNYESTQTVPDSISKSAVNFYSSDFTDDDFKKLDAKGQSTLNAYFYIEEKDGERIPRYQLYSTSGKYGPELSTAVYWLQKAHDLAQKYPDQFDVHLVKSLEYLIDYLKTGDEELFKKHSIEWLKSNSRVDYTYGFIETYNDPKSYRAIFQSDVTIKSMDIDKLNQMLPDVERKLPIPSEFKRKNLDGVEGAMPNASINVKAFTAGSLGPINSTLAYCLPNYEEIRSEHGSKQIIYHAEKSLGELINPAIARKLFNGPEHFAWFEKHDPEHQLMRDIFMLEVILHETLGHGSGKVTTHTFKEGENLTIDGKTYQVGDTIPVTSSNIQQLLAGYDQALEELRAEIMALLAMIECFDAFAEVGMFKEWPQKVGKDKLIDLSIINMARTGLRRLLQQAEDAKEISGDHAKANTTILNFLLDKGGIELRTDQITIDGKKHTVLDVYVIDKEKAIGAVRELACLVQEIKSTGDGLRARELIETMGKPIRNPEYMKIMKDNMKAAAGNVKVSTMIYPIYSPMVNTDGEIIDIKAEWPHNFTEQQQYATKNALSISH